MAQATFLWAACQSESDESRKCVLFHPSASPTHGCYF